MLCSANCPPGRGERVEVEAFYSVLDDKFIERAQRLTGIKIKREVVHEAFHEDHSRVRKDQTPDNFAVLRHIALNLLKQEKTAKGGIHAKQLQAGWKKDYLLKVLDIHIHEPGCQTIRANFHARHVACVRIS
jgi:hypothetical protein